MSVISEHEWNQLFPVTNSLWPYTGKPLCGYSGKQLDIAGQATVQVIYEQQVTDLPLVIIAGMQRPALFRRNWLEAIKLNWIELHKIQSSKMQHLVEKHAPLFEKKIGTIQRYKADVCLRPEAKPVFKKARPVAYSLQSALNQELEYLQWEGIFELVESSNWATPLVMVPKTNGRLRVCGDYKLPSTSALRR